MVQTGRDCSPCREESNKIPYCCNGLLQTDPAHALCHASDVIFDVINLQGRQAVWRFIELQTFEELIGVTDLAVNGGRNISTFLAQMKVEGVEKSFCRVFCGRDARSEPTSLSEKSRQNMDTARLKWIFLAKPRIASFQIIFRQSINLLNATTLQVSRRAPCHSQFKTAGPVRVMLVV